LSAPPTPPAPNGGEHRFRRTLARVLTVQAITLLLLWLLQAGFSS
jgi:hypothetical protein